MLSPGGGAFLRAGQTPAQGYFEKSGWIKLSIWDAAALGDVNGDGGRIVFAGRLDIRAQVWLNEGVAGLVEYRSKR